MRVLCVGRHPYLSEHLCRFFDALGVDTESCVGGPAALAKAASYRPDAVICEYDLLATMQLDTWEHDPALAGVPVVAVSLTRHPGDAHLLDINGIAGFLYLPTLDLRDAQRLLDGLRRTRGGINPPTVFSWPGTTPVTQLR